MKKLVALFACLALLASPAVWGQDKVTYYAPDKTGKKAPAEINGTIESEATTGITVKPTVGATKTIGAGDIIDIYYRLPIGPREDYKKADLAEKAIDRAQDKAKAVKDAVADYQKVLPQVGGQKAAQLHLEFKVAALTARLAAEEKTDKNREAAIRSLTKFKNEHSGAWQLHGCMTTLAQLQLEAKDFAGAVQTYEDLAKIATSIKEKHSYTLEAVQCMLRGGKAGDAERRIMVLKKTLPANDPLIDRLDMQLLAVKAATPGNFDKTKEELQKVINSSRDPNQLAFAHNTLGDCYVLNKRPRDALYEYLYVDLIYNQDKTEHVKAVGQLAILFNELRQPGRAQEYKEKYEKIRR